MQPIATDLHSLFRASEHEDQYDFIRPCAEGFCWLSVADMRDMTVPYTTQEQQLGATDRLSASYRSQGNYKCSNPPLIIIDKGGYEIVGGKNPVGQVVAGATLSQSLDKPLPRIKLLPGSNRPIVLDGRARINAAREERQQCIREIANATLARQPESAIAQLNRQVDWASWITVVVLNRGERCLAIHRRNSNIRPPQPQCK